MNFWAHPTLWIPPLKDNEQLRPPGSQWKGRNGRASAVAHKPRCIFYPGESEWLKFKDIALLHQGKSS